MDTGLSTGTGLSHEPTGPGLMAWAALGLWHGLGLSLGTGHGTQTGPLGTAWALGQDDSLEGLATWARPWAWA